MATQAEEEAMSDPRAKDSLLRCQQKINHMLESWDNISFEQQEISVEEFKSEVEALQFLLGRQGFQDWEASTSLQVLVVGVIFVSLIVIKIWQSFHDKGSGSNNKIDL